MVDWLVTTLRAYPELAIFFALAIGFWIGPIKIAGFSLGNVTATLLAAVVIGQLAITISPNVKSVWSVRVSFANLPDDTYDDIGRALRAVARGYVESYQAQGGKVGEIKLGR
jgi:Predicted Permease Membrane Region